MPEHTDGANHLQILVWIMRSWTKNTQTGHVWRSAHLETQNSQYWCKQGSPAAPGPCEARQPVEDVRPTADASGLSCTVAQLENFLPLDERGGAFWERRTQTATTSHENHVPEVVSSTQNQRGSHLTYSNIRDTRYWPNPLYQVQQLKKIFVSTSLQTQLKIRVQNQDRSNLTP